MPIRFVRALAILAAVASATPAWARCQIGQLAELPVTMRGTRPMVPARINGQDTAFVVDSGAFYSLISPGSAAQFGLRLSAGPVGFRLEGIGGAAQVSVATVKNLTLGALPLTNIQFLVGGSETGGAGLLGQNVLGIADVEYDLGHGMVRLMKPGSECGKADPAYWAADRPVSIIEIDERSFARPHTIGTILLNGVKIRAIFDTGAASSVLSLKAAARAGVTPDSPGVVAGGYESGIGRQVVRSWIAPFADITIGQEEIRNTRLRVADISLTDADMLLGADFFLSHRIYVANRQRKLYFTYDGGPVFNLKPHHVIDGTGAAVAPIADDGAKPTDAEGFARQGAALASKRDLTGAIAAFTQAIALAPTQARYPYLRAMAHLANRQPLPALADLDQSLVLAPDDVEARLSRARLRFRLDERASAIDDLDAADRSAAKQADSRLAIGELYLSADRFDRAIDQFTLWIANHPVDSRRPLALNGRCWSRALAGKDLDAALADCDWALRARPRTPSFLDSRGLVRLRRGEYEKAIADYDVALAAEPRLAWSLYGRGIARRRTGMTAQGDTDIAAATAIDAKLPARAKALGITS